MGDQTRLIKKYPNRRLYDTRTSAYITLSDVKELVLGHEDFQVVDAKTGEDLTRSILLQIILEEESGGVPMFTSDLLSHVIRFYGHALQGMMGKYLENNIKAFSDMQNKLQDQVRGIYGENNSISHDLWSQFLNFQGPALQNMMSAYVEQSKKMFQQMQEQVESQTRNMFTGFQFTPQFGAHHAPAAGKIDPPPPPPAGKFPAGK
ncbi:MAG: polyhydroxyalkanoate synthesis repressor PhaR [Azoarcus sp.]|jgi:polyhydroxyalkanoate synthesis repressor PhaR|nr:polyhydroxyalkanoate synthesis repressor PhaR [Azoarcus sp.]